MGFSPGCLKRLKRHARSLILKIDERLPILKKNCICSTFNKLKPSVWGVLVIKHGSWEW